MELVVVVGIVGDAEDVSVGLAVVVVVVNVVVVIYVE